MAAEWPVQLVEVSVAGLAFCSPYALDVGRTACLRATLAGDAFNCQIRVCWSAAGSRDPSGRRQFTVGAVFLSLEESSGRALRTFLKLSPASESHAKQGR